MSATIKPNLKGRGPGGPDLGPGSRSLYYNNAGLFSDSFLDSIAENESDPFIIENWSDESAEFEACFNFIRDKWNVKKDSFKNTSEQDLQEKWIGPIFQLLGWQYRVNETFKRHSKTVRPDYLLFAEEKHSDRFVVSESRNDFLEPVIALADAKKMGVPLEGSKETNANPSFQIISYLQICEKQWGILTDGQFWRIYSTKSKSQFNSFYEVDLDALVNLDSREAFKYFFNFFRKDAFVKDTSSDQSFLDVVFEEGARYAMAVETDLRERAFKLVEILCQGFAEGRKNLTDESLGEIYEHSLYFLFRLLFILNCEARRILDVFNTSDYYDYSIRKLCEEKRDQLLAKKNGAAQPLAYKRILSLFDQLQAGDPKIGIPERFADEAFHVSHGSFFSQFSISDIHLNQVLVQLAYARDKKDGRLKSIDYKRLSADHLGSIFEGLLEFKPVLKQGAVSLVNDKGEQKMTGSFYTPDHIVDLIVEKTLSPLVASLSVKEILGLRVLDPAVGSGHFLLGVIRFLEQKVLEILNLNAKTNEIDPEKIRSEILHNCIFGVDKNPLAVELAKFSLWIFSAKKDLKIDSLTHQVKSGDSLDRDTFDFSKEFESVLEDKEGFDGIVGNPPYIFARDKKFNDSKKDDLLKKFSWSRYQINTSQYFVEAGYSVLRSGGRLGFILPNTWLTITTSDSFREKLIANSESLEIINCLDKIFIGANVDNAILIATKGSTRSGCLIEKNIYQDGKILKIGNPRRVQPSGEIISFGGERSSKASNNLLSALANHPELGEKFIIKAGLCAYEVGKGSPKQTVEMKEKRVYHHRSKKGKNCRPYLDGKDVKRFFNTWGGEYLDYGPFLAAPRDISLFTGPRVLVRQIPSKPPYCINAAPLFGDELNDRNSMIIQVESEDQAYLVCAVLNSKLISEWFISKFDKFQRKTFPQFKVRDLQLFPFPKSLKNGTEKALIKNACEYRKLAMSSKSNETELSRIQEQIDGLVTKAFSLEEKDSE